MKLIKTLLLSLIVSSMMVVSSYAATISGTVYDYDGTTGIWQTTVKCTSSNGTVVGQIMSNELGQYSLSIPNGTSCTLAASKTHLETTYYFINNSRTITNIQSNRTENFIRGWQVYGTVWNANSTAKIGDATIQCDSEGTANDYQTKSIASGADVGKYFLVVKSETDCNLTASKAGYELNPASCKNRYYRVLSSSTNSSLGSIDFIQYDQSFANHLFTLLLINKYYNDILDRSPEVGAAEGWTVNILNTASLGITINEGFISASNIFFNSAEYLAKNKSNSAYVIDLYQTFLNRSAAQSEINNWVNILVGGLGRNVVLTYFVYSAEFQIYMNTIFGSYVKRPEANLVNDFYRGFYSRLPDTTSFNSNLALMRTAQCSGLTQLKTAYHQMALSFIRNTEYISRARTNTQFVEDMYNGILRRGAQIDEINYWKSLIDNQTYTREQILAFFTGSAELDGRLQAVIAAGCYTN